MALVLCAAILAAQPITVNLRELWQVYDYDYINGEDYGEIHCAAFVVETRHTLPGGIVGWQYAGVIRTEHLIYYDRTENEDTTQIWWGSRTGASGEAQSEAGAIRRILAANAGRPVGDIVVLSGHGG